MQSAVESKHSRKLSATLRRLGQGTPSTYFAVIGILLGSIVFTVILPAVVSVAGNSFYAKGIETRLPKEALQKLGDHRQQVRALETQVDVISKLTQNRTKAIADSAGVGLDMQGLTSARHQLQEDLAQLKANPPISVVGFYLSPQMLLWPGITTVRL